MPELAPDREHPMRVAVRFALIFVGGACGALLRTVLLAADADALLTLFWVNVLGSLGLGALLAAISLVRASAAARSLRAFFGTGVLAGFTSYSALVLGVTELGLAHVLGAVSYGLATVVLGVCAAWLGFALVTRAFRGQASTGANA